jgi:hypothetical protein
MATNQSILPACYGGTSSGWVKFTTVGMHLEAVLMANHQVLGSTHDDYMQKDLRFADSILQLTIWMVWSFQMQMPRNLQSGMRIKVPWLDLCPRSFQGTRRLQELQEHLQGK